MARVLPPPPDRDPLTRMIISHWVLGALTGVALAIVLLAIDLGGLRSLIMRSDMVVPALALLFGGFAVTFGGVIAATAVMLAQHDSDGDDDSGHGAFLRQEPALVPVRVRARRRP
jgi:hypothetical protein